jgi:ketosteroid isomerase-like protein
MQDDTIAANKQIARQFFLNFERGDVEAVIGLFSPDASYWMPTVRKEYGMTEFKDGLRWIQSRLNGGIRFELGPIVAEQNLVCIQAESFATTTDGKSFNNLYHIFFEIRDGKLPMRGSTMIQPTSLAR